MIISLDYGKSDGIIHNAVLNYVAQYVYIFFTVVFAVESMVGVVAMG
jgi:hypothetical protein